MKILRDPAPVDGGTVKVPALPIIKQTPNTPKPVPEHVEKQEFNDDITSLDDIKVEQLPEHGGEVKKEEKIVEQPKKEDEKVVEQPKEEKKEEEVSPLLKVLKAPAGKEEKTVDGEKKEIIKPIIPGARDYSGYSPEEVGALKQMGNEGFALASRLIKDNKELSKLKDSTYLQHPQSFVLSPEYQTLQTDVQYAAREGDYWKQQLITMDSGKPWKPITGWDAQGNPVLGAERQANKADEEQVRVMMNNAYQVANQKQTQLQEFPNKYKQQYQTDLQRVQQERTNRFAWVADPKLLDYTINVDGLGMRSLKQIKEDFVSIFPTYLRNHPALEVASDLMVALRVQSAQLSELQTGKQVEKTIEDEKSKIEPTSKDKLPAPKGKVHGVEEFQALPDGF